MNDMPMIPSSGTPSPVQGGTLQTDRMARDPERSAALAPEIVKALSTVYDPEIPINIYDLGLIYDILVDGSNAVGIKMTLTAPACPAAQILPEQVRAAAASVPGVSGVVVDVVWDPPWGRDRLSDAARLQLGLL